MPLRRPGSGGRKKTVRFGTTNRWCIYDINEAPAALQPCTRQVLRDMSLNGMSSVRRRSGSLFVSSSSKSKAETVYTGRSATPVVPATITTRSKRRTTPA